MLSASRLLGSESADHVRAIRECQVKHCYLRFDVLLTVHVLNGPWLLYEKVKEMVWPPMSKS